MLSESDSSSEAASFRAGRAQFWLSSQIIQIQLRHRRSKIFPGMSCFSALMILDFSHMSIIVAIDSFFPWCALRS